MPKKIILVGSLYFLVSREEFTKKYRCANKASKVYSGDEHYRDWAYTSSETKAMRIIRPQA